MKYVYIIYIYYNNIYEEIYMKIYYNVIYMKRLNFSQEFY